MSVSQNLIMAFLMLAFSCTASAICAADKAAGPGNTREADMENNKTITLFLSGDVMTGRGIDQILPRSVTPILHEPYVRDARDYVRLAELVNGPLPRPVGPSYVWGDALAVLDDVRPDLRIINLETSITTSDEYWPKGINYRMHPENIGVLTAAKIDCCVLANNHVLDWGRSGLVETLQTLKQAAISQAGAGLDHENAVRPAIFRIPGKGRVLVFAYGSPTSGIPLEWAAGQGQPGISILPNLSTATARNVRNNIAEFRQPEDIVLVSIHWGENWGYEIPAQQRRFAHWLIDEADVDLIHGHSSHHVKGIEVYRDRLILYGCGDYLNDYEGISGHEQYRDDLTLMYFPRLAANSGKLSGLRLVPMQIKRFQTIHPRKEDILWLLELLNRLGKELNTMVKLNADNSVTLFWNIPSGDKL